MHTISPYIKVSSIYSYLLIAMPMPLHTSSFAHMWSWKPCDCDAQTVYDHFCLPLLTDMRVIFVADSGVFSRLGWGWSIRTPGTPGFRWSARRVRPVGPLRCSSGPAWHLCCMWARALACCCMACEQSEPPRRGGSTSISMSAWLCRSV